MLLFVTKLPNDSEQIRSVVCRLLQRGIDFTGCAEQHIPDTLPDDWENYPALIIDSSILENYASVPAMRRRLEDYARNKFILPLYNRLSPDAVSWRDLALTDINMFISAAELHPKPMPQRSVAELIPFAVERLRNFYTRELPVRDMLGEFFLHLPLAALALEGSPYVPPNWSDYLNDIWRQTFQIRDFSGDQDQVAAWNWAFTYAQRTGDMEVAEFMLKICDILRTRRPRTSEGIIAPGGFMDDPLFFSHIGTHRFCNLSATVAKRNLVMNENFHYLSGLFASAFEMTGSFDYLEESLKMLRAIDRSQRDSDDLLFHASCRGKAIGSKWARGCGHALFGAYYLLRLAPSLPRKIQAEAVNFIDRTGRALANVQLPCGAWRNVLDAQNGEPELSCTTMFTTIYAELVNKNLLDREFYLPMLQKAFSALRTYVWRGATINSAGTYVAAGYSDYYVRRHDFFYPVAWIIPALIEAEKCCTNSGRNA